MSTGPDEARKGLDIILGPTKEDNLALKRYNNIIKELSGTHYTTEDGTSVPVNIQDILSHVAIESGNFRDIKQREGGPAKTIWGLETEAYNALKDFIYEDGRIKKGMGQKFIDTYVEKVIRNGSTVIRGRIGRKYADQLSDKDVEQLKKEFPDFTFKVLLQRTNNGPYRQIEYRTKFPSNGKKDKWERYLQSLRHNVQNKFALFRDCWSSGGVGNDEPFMEGQPILQELYASESSADDSSALDALRRIYTEKNADMPAMDKARYMINETIKKKAAIDSLMHTDFSKYEKSEQTTTVKQPEENIWDKIGSFFKTSIMPYLPPAELFSPNPKLYEYLDSLEEPKPIKYIIKYGDTFNGIANKYGVSAEDLQKDNNITDPNKIKEGQVLKIRQSK